MRAACDADKRNTMNLSRYLTEERVKLEMTTVIDPPGEETNLDRWRQESKETVLAELVELIQVGTRVGNPTKLLIDFVNRERKATTGIGLGVAIPHIRSMQAKEFIMAFARSADGYEFDSLDQKPAHLFFVMAAPPYEDQLYLRAFKSLSEMLQFPEFRKELMHLSSPGEVIRALRAHE